MRAGRKNQRAEAGRAHHGKMVPHGASTMSDEEFWSWWDERCDPVSAVEASRNTGTREGHTTMMIHRGFKGRPHGAGVMRADG